MSNWLFPDRDEVGGETEGPNGVDPADADVDPRRRTWTPTRRTGGSPSSTAVGAAAESTGRGRRKIDDFPVVSSPGDLTGVGIELSGIMRG